MTAYETAVLADSPKGYWKLGDRGAGTTATDSSGFSHNGTYGSGIADVDAGVNDPDNCILVHQTANDYMQVADHADFKPTAAIAVEVWFARVGTGGNQRIVQKGTGDQGLRIYATSTQIVAKLRISGSDREIAYAYPSSWNTDATFHHLVFTWAGTGTKTELWIDKVKVVEFGSNITGTIDTNTDALEWGRKASGDSTGDHWDGYLDEAAFFAAALNSTQIAAHYDAQSGTSVGLRVTHEGVEAVVGQTSPITRVTSESVEAVVVDNNPELRVSQVFIEAVIERDYAYWEIPILEIEASDLTAGGAGGGEYSGGSTITLALTPTTNARARTKSSGVPIAFTPGSGPAYRKNVAYRNNSTYRG